MANESRPLFRPGRDISVLTTAAVTGKTFVKVSATIDATTGMIKAAPATSAGAVLGVAAYDIASGAVGPVLRGGVVEVTAGGAITAGAQVEVGTGGKAVVLASGIAVGMAVQTASADGDTIFVALGA